MTKLIDLTNEKFGKLTVVKLLKERKRQEAVWLCDCSCGAKTKVAGSLLRSGMTKSCGCYRKEFKALNHKTHGSSRTVEYRSWGHINTRCNNPKSKDYKDYGGRGIKNNFKSFEDFLNCVGPRPGPAYSIDRIDVNGHYEYGNCKWSTRLEQNSNKRSVQKITFNNTTLTAAGWSRRLGISDTTIRRRLQRNLPIQMVLTK